MGVNDIIKEYYENDVIVKKIKPVVYDGIVNEDLYRNEPNPTLFLLKDANPDAREDEGGNANVCKDLYETANEKDEHKIRLSASTWRNVCRWTGFMKSEINCEADCLKNDEFDVLNMHKYLNYIAVVNIKKTFGKGVNNDKNKYDKELKDAVNNYYDLISKEINLIDPKIIICGGTFDYILPYYFKDKKERKSAIKTLSSGCKYFVISEEGKNRIFLDFKHPGCRIDHKILFAYFKETYKDVLEKYNELTEIK